MLANIKKSLVILLLLINVFFVGQDWVASTNIADRGTDALDCWEAQMALVRDSLPIKRGVVGYISEQDVPGAEYGLWDIETEFFLTQYALAPLIVKKGIVAEWNVVVLSNKDLAIWAKTYTGQYKIIDVEGKVHVLHRLETP